MVIDRSLGEEPNDHVGVDDHDRGHELPSRLGAFLPRMRDAAAHLAHAEVTRAPAGVGEGARELEQFAAAQWRYQVALLVSRRELQLVAGLHAHGRAHARGHSHLTLACERRVNGGSTQTHLLTHKPVLLTYRLPYST